MIESMPFRPVAVPFRALMSGPFGWFFVGRSIDMAGTAMAPVALALAILGVTHSPTDLGVVLAAQMVPYLIVVVLGGVVADRVNRRNLLIVANTGLALTQGAIATVLLTGHYSLGLVAGISFASGVLAAFTSPALRGIVPELVPPERTQQANAALASSRNATRILGPTLAAILVAGIGGGWAIAADAASYSLAAIVFTRIGTAGRPPLQPAHLIRDLRDGWYAFTSRRWVVVMTLTGMLLNAINVGPWNVLGPLLVSKHSGAGAWGAIVSVRAGGLLLMSVLMYRIRARHPLRMGRAWGTLSALPLLLLGLTSSIWWLAIAAFAGGIGFTMADITWDTSLQQHVPPEVLARVASYDDLLSYVPFSQILVGPLASHFGPAPVATACGLTYAITSLAPLTQHEVRHLEATSIIDGIRTPRAARK